MPVTRTYTSGSIIYFEADLGEDIYVLQQGKIVLTSTAIDSGDELREEVKLGEFFGVKSSLGRYPREETAQCLGKTTLITFKVNEFEQFVLKNPRLVMKMTRVFSKQLRNIHRKVRDTLKAGETRGQPYEMMNVAEVFYKIGQTEHAKYAFKKYLSTFPGGAYEGRARDLLGFAEKGANYPIGYPKLEVLSEPDSPDMPSFGDTHAPDLDDLGSGDLDGGDLSSGESLADLFYEGLNEYSRENFPAALEIYNRCINWSNKNDPEFEEFSGRALFEKGKALLKTGKVNDARNAFTQYVKHSPGGEHMREALLNMAIIGEKEGNRDYAAKLYQKILASGKPDAIAGQAKNRLAKLGS